MKLRNPRLIRAASWVVAEVIRFWLWTVRHQLDPITGKGHPADPDQARFIYAFWHESLLFPLAFRHTRAYVLISMHADGELIGRACQQLGVGVVRGSSTRGGGAGLVALCHRSKDSHLIMMPDGPRGPRRRLHPGIIVLASKTGLPIIPVGVGYTRARRFTSWDRFALPLPFSRVVGVAGRPMSVPADIGRDEVESYRQEVEQAFLDATAAAERWADELAGRARPATARGPHVNTASPTTRPGPSPAPHDHA